MIVCDVFPTALAIEKIDVDQTDLDKLLLLVNEKDKLIKNQKDNFFHDNTYIFDTVLKGSKLVKDITSCINQYCRDILGEEPTLRHTQSWLNVNPPGSSHHKHFHGNSILSGVLYLQVDDRTGKFLVHRENENRISKEVKNYNQYNYKYLFFEPKQYELYIFPSSLNHSVDENTSCENRISLSFNTFYYGDIIGDGQLTDIRFKEN
jgi:uncharacterized protein (TIGR02466 family)